MMYIPPMEYVAYAGTILIFGSSQIPNRFWMHVVRIFGTLLWYVYALHLENIPLIVTEITAVGFDMVAALRFRRKDG